MPKSSETQTFVRFRGVSLIEVLVVVAILALVFAGILSVYSSAQRSIANKNVLSNMFKDSRTVINRFMRDAMEAIEVVPGPVVLDSQTFYASDTCVIFKVGSLDQDGNIIDNTTDFDLIVYSLNPLDQNILERRLRSKNGISFREDSTQTLLINLDSLTFTCLDAEGTIVSDYFETVVIRLLFSLQGSGVGRTYQESFQTGTRLRNKAQTQ